MDSQPKPGAADRSRSAPWLGLIVVALAFAAGAALTWRKWPDVLVDFGVQLYLPWKIASGSVLYKDVMYLTGGPLSQYYHALLFKLFDVSLLTLVVSNLVIAAALVAFVYRAFLAASDAWTATIIALGIVLVFTFNQYSDIGNFNYITPYCHEIWHGLVLSIAAIALLSRWVAKERMAHAAGAGFCGGLVFMTKPEVFAALAVGAVAAFVMFWMTKRRGAFLWKSIVVFLVAGLVPLAGFALYFHRVEGWRDSLRSVAFAWVPLLGSSASHNAFYRWCLGLDTPGANLLAMLVQFLVVVAVVIISALLFRGKMDASARRMALVAWIALLLTLASGYNWVDCGRSLPLLALVGCGLLFVDCRMPPPERRPVFPFLWSVFGLALLAKLGLHSRVWHYGFALAMPAFAGAIYLLLWILPARLEKYGVQRRPFRVTVWLVLMAGYASLFLQSQRIYVFKTAAVGSGRDKIMAFDISKSEYNPWVGRGMRSALEWMGTNTPPDATLAVLPEGALANYLSRRTNPTGYLVWNPAELAAFGQDKMTAAFQGHPPDYVMLIHRDAAEYGAKYFGQEDKFGRQLMQWILRNYEPVFLIGAEPLQTNTFGIKILKRVSAPPAVAVQSRALSLERGIYAASARESSGPLRRFETGLADGR